MSSMRIGGLASGMDIDSIVEDLIKIERTKVDSATQDKTLLEWTQDAYNDVNKKFADFVLNTRQSLGLTQTSTGTISDKSVSSLTWIKGASIEDSDIADVTARANSINGSYKINVQRLATNWSAASSQSISDPNSTDTSNVKSQFALGDEETINFTIFTNKDTEEEQSIGITMDKDKVNIHIQYNTDLDKDGNKDSKTITLDGKNISNISLGEVVKEINNGDIGVTAIYDESIDRFFLQTDKVGESNSITITQGEGVEEGVQVVDFISKLHLQHIVYDQDGTEIQESVLTNQEYKGTDALIDFGAAKGIVQSSNQFTINNIDFNIKALGTTTVRVDTDEEAVIDKIKSFVNEYNELIDSISEKLGETRYQDYPPLTSEQKEAMSDREIELWEEKAKSGLIRNDQIISRTLQTIRSGLYQKVEGVSGSFNQLTQIGIETQSYSYGSTGGKLQVDEDKLRSVLRDDVDGVMELLFKNPDTSTTDTTEQREQTGLIGRIYGDMVDGMKQVIVKAGTDGKQDMYRSINFTMLFDFVKEHSSISMLDQDIIDYEEKILELESRLIDKENSYWEKFTAMETALNNMYSQSSWLSQQFGSGQ